MMSSFHIYLGINSKSFPWPVHSVQKATTKVFFCIRRYSVISYDVGLSGRGLMKSLGERKDRSFIKLECGPVPNVMAALPNIGGALCSMPQSLTDAHYQSAVQ